MMQDTNQTYNKLFFKGMIKLSLKEEYRVSSIPRSQTHDWLLYKHYAKRLPSISYAFGLYDKNNDLQGVCTFGQPPSAPILQCCGEKYAKHVIELNRLIKNDGLPANTQTYFAAQCIRQLPTPMVIISFSDLNYKHYGVTYQALNFYFTGYGGSTADYSYHGKPYHQRHIQDYWFRGKCLDFDKAKTIDWNFKNVGGEIVQVEKKCRYLYFHGSKTEKKDMKKHLKYPILPYPKGDNENYDASYQPDIQQTFFS